MQRGEGLEVVGRVQRFFELSEGRLEEGGGLVGAAEVGPLHSVRRPGALTRPVAPNVHILAELVVAVGGAARLRRPSL